MSTSVGRPSALGLALQSLPSPRSGNSDHDVIGDKSTSAQAEMPFAAFDTDADAKSSKAGLRTGFQKLSQNMKSVLLDQQKSAADGKVPSPGPSTETATTPARTSIDAIQLLENLVQMLQKGSVTAISNELDSNSGGSADSSAVTTVAVTPPQIASTTGNVDDAEVSKDDWTAILQNLDQRDMGDLANQRGMYGQQLSANLNESLTTLLQSIAS